jgi:carbonic anhydrase
MKFISVILVPVLFALVSCSSSEKKKEMKKEEVVVEKEQVQADIPEAPKKEVKKMEPKMPHWSYTGAFGPQFWGNLDEKYALCKSGKNQSPINLVWKKPEVEGSSLALNYKETKLNIANSGNGLEIKLDAGSFLNHNDKMYELKSIDFHNESEHQLSGKSFPVEMHLMHESSDGKKAIISVFFKQGKEHSVFSKILSKLPANKGAEVSEPSFVYTPSVLLPSKLHHYSYMGSLTTPPCTEGVQWLVLNTPVEISPAQIDKIKSVYAGNKRPIQPLNARSYQNY